VPPVRELPGANFAAKWARARSATSFRTWRSRCRPRTRAAHAGDVREHRRVLRDGGYPTGNAELPGDATQLRGIAIGAPVDGAIAFSLTGWRQPSVALLISRARRGFFVSGACDAGDEFVALFVRAICASTKLKGELCFRMRSRNRLSDFTYGAAETFYRDVLGLRLGASRTAHWSSTRRRRSRVSPVPSTDCHAHRLGFAVEDVNAVIAWMSARGFRSSDSDSRKERHRGHAGRRAVAWFRDPIGNILSVVQLPERLALRRTADKAKDGLARVW
jgi:hypothetical protein